MSTEAYTTGEIHYLTIGLKVCFLCPISPSSPYPRPILAKRVMKSRGNSRNCGDGPYLQVIKTASFQPDVSVIASDGVSRQISGSYAIPKNGYRYFVLCTGDAVYDFTPYESISGRWNAHKSSFWYFTDEWGTDPWYIVTKRETCQLMYTKGMSDAAVFSMLQTAVYQYPQRTGAGPPGATVIVQDDIDTGISFSFKYNEDQAFGDAVELGIVPPMYSSGLAAAYVDAATSLPQTAVNTVANVLQVAEKLKSLLIDHDIGLARTAKDLWLQYRYEAVTTTSDVLEYIDLTNRLIDLCSANDISSYGSFNRGDIVFRCAIKVSASSIMPDSASSWLKTYGFKLNAVNAWDMVPYSFVVDWFLHVSDILEYFENIGIGYQIKPSQIWYSWVSNYDNQVCYARVPGWVPYTLPSYNFRESNGRTWLNRVVDALCLFSR